MSTHIFFLKRIELEHIMSHKYAKQNSLVYILLEPGSIFETRYFKTLQNFPIIIQKRSAINISFSFELYVPRVKNVKFDYILSDSFYEIFLKLSVNRNFWTEFKAWYKVFLKLFHISVVKTGQAIFKSRLYQRNHAYRMTPCLVYT